MDETYFDPASIPPPEKKGKLRRLIVKMGLGAFMISVIVHAIFAVLAIVFFYTWVYPPEEKIDFLPGGGGGGGSGGETVHKLQQVQQKRMMSNTAVSKRIASTSNTALFSLPDASNDLMDPGLPMDVTSELGSGGGSGGGQGTGKGTGIGSGTGPGKGFGEGQLGIGALIPTIMKGRCSDAERLSQVREAGGTPEVEAAVKKSLQWLKGRQNSNGSWGKSYQPAMTGLVLLCYLGHCESTQSPEYGENVTKAIAFLVDISLKNNGRIGTSFTGHQWVYEHGIATYALSEALTFSRTLQFKMPELEAAVEKAVDVIIKGQTKAGGWDYGFKDTSRNDLSVVGWQMQALKAAKASGVKAPDLDKIIRRATDWLLKDAYLSDGKFAYTGKGANPAMTAVGVLCLQQWDKGNSKPAREGIRLMKDGLDLRGKKVNNPKPSEFEHCYTFEYDNPNADLYAWYYAAQAMRNAGGKEWDETNKALIADIVPAQNSDGSFKIEPGGGKVRHGNGTAGAGGSRDIYVQALNTLTLQVYYRFLPTSAGKGGRSSGLDALR
jgi:hypothetical protein